MGAILMAAAGGFTAQGCGGSSTPGDDLNFY